jgi:hypothetical protein
MVVKSLRVLQLFLAFFIHFDVATTHNMMVFDAPPNSLIDSTMNPKVKIMEEGVGIRSLVRNILVLEGCDEDPRWGLR